MAVVIVLIVVSHASALVLETWLFSGASFNLRHTLYAHLQRVPFSELSRHRTGALSYRATSDVAAFETGLTELFSVCTFDVLVGAGVAVAMALTDARLTAVVVAIMVASIVVSGRVGRPLPGLKRVTQTLGARLAGMLQESLAASRTVRAYGGEALVVARLDDVNQKLLATD